MFFLHIYDCVLAPHVFIIPLYVAIQLQNLFLTCGGVHKQLFDSILKGADTELLRWPFNDDEKEPVVIMPMSDNIYWGLFPFLPFPGRGELHWGDRLRVRAVRYGVNGHAQGTGK